jgi:hypothetical protein
VNCGAKALKALSWTLTRLNEETLPSALFPQPPVVWFAPADLPPAFTQKNPCNLLE